VRYLWKVATEKKAVAVAVPWTRVNNCTRQWQAELKKRTENNLEAMAGKSIATDDMILKWKNRHKDEFKYEH